MSLLQHPCEAVIGPVYPWLTNVINAAQVRGLNREDLVNRPIDHFCYRCRTKEEYVDVRGRLTSDDIGELVVESMIGGIIYTLYHLHMYLLTPSLTPRPAHLNRATRTTVSI